MKQNKSLIIRTEDLINSDLWRMFPIICVDYLADIPSDYPGAMAVPITIMSKLCREQFELLGRMPDGARLESGRVPYKRIVIRHLHPALPPEIDLLEWFRRCGLDLDVEVIIEKTDAEMQ